MSVTFCNYKTCSSLWQNQWKASAQHYSQHHLVDFVAASPLCFVCMLWPVACGAVFSSNNKTSARPHNKDNDGSTKWKYNKNNNQPINIFILWARSNEQWGLYCLWCWEKHVWLLVFLVLSLLPFRHLFSIFVTANSSPCESIIPYLSLIDKIIPRRTREEDRL